MFLLCCALSRRALVFDDNAVGVRVGFVEFDAILNTGPHSVFAVCKSDVFKQLPVGAALHDREPRPCHEVAAVHSEARPDVIEPHTLYRAADFGRQDVNDFINFMVGALVKGDAFAQHADAHDTVFVRHTNGKECMGT